jgi:hypothetical protein
VLSDAVGTHLQRILGPFHLFKGLRARPQLRGGKRPVTVLVGERAPPPRECRSSA